MNDINKHIWYHSRKNHSGFVSVFFLAVFLYVSAITAVIAVNDSAKAKTMINLEINNQFLLAETRVIADFKCQLRQEKIRREKKNDEETIDEIDERTFASGVYYTAIQEPQGIEMIIYYDTETLEVLEYESSRNPNGIVH